MQIQELCMCLMCTACAYHCHTQHSREHCQQSYIPSYPQTIVIVQMWRGRRTTTVYIAQATCFILFFNVTLFVTSKYVD